jgi:hypothetical protein
MTLAMERKDTGTDSVTPNPWASSFTVEDLVGVAEFLAGNLIAHRAQPEACIRELAEWANRRPEGLARAACSIADDTHRRPAHELLTRTVAFVLAG